MAAASLQSNVLIPKIVTRERPIALMPTMIRWWQALLAQWQFKCRIDWDATDGCNGGAQRTVWAICRKWRISKIGQERKIKEQ